MNKLLALALLMTACFPTTWPLPTGNLDGPPTPLRVGVDEPTLSTACDTAAEAWEGALGRPVLECVPMALGDVTMAYAALGAVNGGDAQWGYEVRISERMREAGEDCLAAVVTHEFGHMLGAAHCGPEAERPERGRYRVDEECTVMRPAIGMCDVQLSDGDARAVSEGRGW